MKKISLNIQKGIKRIFDFSFSFLVLLFFMPLGLVIIILIKLDSPGPDFFLQQRPGYNLQFFQVYKFRTMWYGAEPTLQGQEVLPDDERLTRVGRFLRRYKIDELPQLCNVLKGEMSLVGPRPENMHNLSGYNAEELKRFRVKPGLTGLAQVNGNIYLPLSARHQYDLYYLENFSLGLDLKIMLRTLGVILCGEQKFIRYPEEKWDQQEEYVFRNKL